MRKLNPFLLLLAVLFYGGCNVVTRLATPTNSEMKIAAEYDLGRHQDQKILVLVNQPSWLNAQMNLRYYLTEAMNKKLTTKVRIPSDRLVDYSELSEFRSNKDDFSLLSDVQVGKALGADIVLLIVIDGYRLDELADSGYYSGFAAAKAALFETVKGKELWPDSKTGKSIKVGFEVEKRGREVAIERLAASLAHCTVRYLYNCPKTRFKIIEDKSGASRENW